MRMIMYVSFPVETFNEAVRDGSAGPKIKRVLDHVKPEATYFTAHHGQRTAIVVVDMADVSKIRRSPSRGFFCSMPRLRCIR